MKFSERYGYTNEKDRFQVESIDKNLSISIWNVLYTYLFFAAHREYDISKRPPQPFGSFYRKLWVIFMNESVDTFPLTGDELFQDIKNYYDNYCTWYNKYNLIEFCLDECGFNPKTLAKDLNMILEREQSAYRIIDKKICPIISEIEIKSIEKALENDGKFKVVSTHLNRALELLSDRKQPDYRNSIKESISSVETLCKIIGGDDKDSLGKAIKKIENLNPTLRAGFEKLYGYTNNAGGIRHALTGDDYEVNQEDAQFMLVSCSAFVNYLIQKQANAPVKEVVAEAN